MKRNTKTLLVIFTALMAGISCDKQAMDNRPTTSTVESEKTIAAYINDKPITMDALETSAKGQLQQLWAKIYQAKLKTLNDMINNMLIDAAAKEAGMSTEAYLAENVEADVTPPTDEEITAFYDKQKDRIKVPLEQMKGKISDYLKNMRLLEKKQRLIARLREKADVKILLQPPRTEVSLDNAAYTVGDKKAEIVLVEFSDYQCPYSKKVQPAVHRILDEYKGKIHYAFLDYPLPFHKDALKGHEAARCAGEQGKYSEFSKKLFDNQKKMGITALKNYAKDIGLEEKTFEACLDSGKFSEKIQQSVKKGQHSGVSGTPAFFINGIMLTGAQPFEAFQELVKRELK